MVHFIHYIYSFTSTFAHQFNLTFFLRHMLLFYVVQVTCHENSAAYVDTVENVESLQINVLHHIPCSAHHFTCNSTQQCILMKYQCDGERDCEDWSDERECKDTFGCTPLYTAALFGNIYAVRSLLHQGAFVEARCNYNSTALHAVAASNATNASAVAEILLQHGANVNSRTTLNNTAIMMASENGNSDLIRLLLKYGAQVRDKNVRNVTSLMLAARSGNVHVFRILLDHGAELDATDDHGLTVIHYATSPENKSAGKMIDYILSLTSNKTEERNVYGCTPLYTAALFGNIDAVRSLLQHGAFIEATCYGNLTALYAAVANDATNATTVTEILLQHGANVHSRNIYDLTLIMYASSRGKSDLLKLLLKHGAEVRDKNVRNVTSLMLAARSGNVHVFRILLDHGADLDATDDNGLTVIHYAAASLNESAGKMIDYILSLTSNKTEERNVNGCTPLYTAAHFGNIYAVRSLLQHGALIEATCYDNKTALHAAALSDAKSAAAVVEILLQYGANVLSRDKFHKMPMNYAHEMGKEEVLKLLLKHLT